MKTIVLLCVLGWLAAPRPAIRSIALTLQTRGVQKEIRVDARQTRITLNNRVTSQPTPARHWQRLTALVARLSLPALPTFPTSTRRQAADAALSAQIHIVTATKTYESALYDHPDAPPQTRPLLNALINGVPVRMRPEFR